MLVGSAFQFETAVRMGASKRNQVRNQNSLRMPRMILEKQSLYFRNREPRLPSVNDSVAVRANKSKVIDMGLVAFG
jgi:hypothetical protein